MSLRLSVTSARKPAPEERDFTSGPVRIGRASTSDVVLEGDMVSRTHVLLEEVPGGWQVSHQGSITPTLRNGRAVKPGRPEPLADGDLIQVADHRVQVAILVETMMPELEPLRDSLVARLEPEDADRTRVASARSPSPQPSAPPVAARPGPAGRTVPTLAVYAGLPDPARLEFREVGKNYVLGRAATCDLVLPIGAVSRQHGFARYDGARVHLRDAGARNPILVNGRPIVGEVPLNHGDMVTIGAVELRFASEPDASSPGVTGGAFSGSGSTIPLDVQQQAGPAQPGPTMFPSAPAAGGWSPQPAPAEGGGWDAVARGDASPGWSAEPVPALEPLQSLPPEPEPVDLPPPPQAPDWSALAAPPKREAPATAFAAPRPPAAPPAPPPPAWDVPDAAAPEYEPPPRPAPNFSAPPPAPPPAAPPPQQRPAPLAPPGAAGGVAEPKVVPRRAPTQKGWLVAGIASMVVAVTLGLLLVILAL